MEKSLNFCFSINFCFICFTCCWGFKVITRVVIPQLHCVQRQGSFATTDMYTWISEDNLNLSPSTTSWSLVPAARRWEPLALVAGFFFIWLRLLPAKDNDSSLSHCLVRWLAGMFSGQFSVLICFGQPQLETELGFRQQKSECSRTRRGDAPNNCSGFLLKDSLIWEFPPTIITIITIISLEVSGCGPPLCGCEMEVNRPSLWNEASNVSYDSELCWIIMTLRRLTSRLNKLSSFPARSEISRQYLMVGLPVIAAPSGHWCWQW